MIGDFRLSRDLDFAGVRLLESGHVERRKKRKKEKKKRETLKNHRHGMWQITLEFGR
jgi:hypothetical protein